MRNHILFSFLPCIYLKKTPVNMLLGYECVKCIFDLTT
jgi:hypothetical protein